MKKVLPIALILLILLSATCFAAYEPDSTRWQWLYSTDEVGTFLDKDTIRYSDNHNEVEFWICHVYPQKDAYYLRNCSINKNAMTLEIFSYAKYNSTTEKLLDSYTYKSYEIPSTKIIPGTIGELLYRTLFPN